MIRALFLCLILVAGSVQAHASYHCSMMETVVHDDCCCGDMDSPAVPLTDTEPCCDKAVNLGIDTETDQAQSSAKTIKFKSDVDPPEPIAPVIEFEFLLFDSATRIAYLSGDARFDAERYTYLITRRLRI